MTTSTHTTTPPETQDLDRPKVKLKSKTLDGSAVDEAWDGETGADLGLGKGWRDKGKGGVPSWLQGSVTSSYFLYIAHFYLQRTVRLWGHPHPRQSYHRLLRRSNHRAKSDRWPNAADGKPFCWKQEA